MLERKDIYLFVSSKGLLFKYYNVCKMEIAQVLYK